MSMAPVTGPEEVAYPQQRHKNAPRLLLPLRFGLTDVGCHSSKASC